LLFAWHPTHPDDWFVIPPEEKAYWDVQQRLLPGAATLVSDLKLLHEDLPATPSAATKPIEDARNLRKMWMDLAHEANTRLANVQLLEPPIAEIMQTSDLQPTADAIVGRSGKPQLDAWFRMVGTHDKLVKAIKDFEAVEIRLEGDGKFQAELIVKSLDTCRADLEKLQRRLEAMQERAGDLGMDPDGLLAGLRNRLNNFQMAFNSTPVPAPGTFRFQDYQKLSEIMRHCEASFARLSARWGVTKPYIPTKEELNSRRNELSTMPDLTDAYAVVTKSLFEAKQTANERLKRVDRKPAWVYWLADHFA
jgi:hypothetical protein